jgi:hypothetical protein
MGEGDGERGFLGAVPEQQLDFLRRYNKRKQESYMYKAKYDDGTRVRIADLATLEEFRRTWKYHHALQPEQLAYAGRDAEVERTGFYHGGDVLVWLKDIPGVWHEVLVLKAD